jgi:RNA polymerase sigma-70 factor (ECF subfamily)
MDKSSLDKLIERSILNDEKAFRLIVEEYQHMIYTLSFRLLCNEEEAKDVAQETFVRVWLNLSKYNPEMKFSTWIYTIATNLCLDKLKSPRKIIYNELTDMVNTNLLSTECADKQLLNNELGELILTLTDSLSPKQKVVFTLNCLEELDVDEIVEITGFTPENIKSNLFLAKKNIRCKLEKY